jgi:formylglycine-generating enzyme required for sulfatase activity
VTSDAQVELQAWTAAQSGNTAGGYAAYLEEYPKGRFAAAARVARASLAAAAVAPPPAPVKPVQATPPVAQTTFARADQTIKDCADCPEMVAIPAGSFDMGSKEEVGEGPVHRVNVPAFLLGRTEVTQSQWRAVMGNNPSRFSNCGVYCPVENISWNDAQEFARRLSQKTGKTYRLPSEAEWEYAVRAGSNGKWSFGDDQSQLEAYAWFRSNSRSTPNAVAQRRPNTFGLYDMHGNVWEWVQDVWHEDYRGAPDDGSAWVNGGDQARRVLRGGAWFGLPRLLRSANRILYSPVIRDGDTGMRIARTH